jgi:IMP dehydrogenase/GMP reductase
MMEKNAEDKNVSEEDKVYEESVRRIQSAVKQSIPFGQAAKLVDVEDEGLRRAIVDDALKVLIAEMHFTGGKDLKELSARLKLPLKRLETAKAEMLKDVEAAAIDAYKQETGGEGSAGNA